MLTIFLRAVVLYLLMVIAMRALGKRQLGQFQPYEFAVTIIIADLISTPIGNVSTPLMQGVLPVAAVFILHTLISFLTFKSDRLRSVISGRPSVIVKDGVIDRQEMQRLCLTLSDLLEALRQNGILDPANVTTAVFETNGTISAFANGRERPASAEEAAIDAKPDHLPVVLVMDGRIQTGNLKESRLSAEWLDGQLGGAGLNVGAVYLATLDDDGIMRIQTRDGTRLEVQTGESRSCKP